MDFDTKEGFLYPGEVFDSTFQGVMGGELVVIAAESNSGKTTFAMDMIERNAKRGKKCYYMNFEFSIETMWASRWLWENNKPKTSLTDISPLTEQERADMDKYVKEKLEQFEYYNNPNGATIDDIIDKISVCYSIGFTFFVIDSFSRIIGNSDSKDTWMNQNVTMAKLQEVAQRLDICIVVLHHTNKNGKFEGSQKIMDIANVMILISKEVDAELSPYRKYQLVKDKFVPYQELELYYKNGVYSYSDL